MISTAVILSALELGFIYALVALALFLSFRILNIADKIIVLANGHLRQIGSKDEVLPALLAGSSPAVCSALSEKVR